MSIRMSNRMPLHTERLYPPYQIAALVELLKEAGVAPLEVLRGTGLDDVRLNEVKHRTSIDQYLTAADNAMRLCGDASLAFRLGRRLHLSDHGMVGLLLLSCDSGRDHLRLAHRYELLMAPTVTFEAIDGGGGGEGELLRLCADDSALANLPGDLRRFLVEQQVVQQATHLQDAMGVPCRPLLARFAHPAPPHEALYADALQCPCVFGCERTELHYPRELLDQRPCLANPLTASMLQSTCDGLMADIETSLGFAGKVDAALRQMRDPGASMKAVAAALNMTDRTLRRRLADEGTSFTAISHRLKYCVATQHLKRSAASVEQIAAIAGFSDPANFRRAFIRWTHMSPAQFRRHGALSASA